MIKYSSEYETLTLDIYRGTLSELHRSGQELLASSILRYE